MFGNKREREITAHVQSRMSITLYALQVIAVGQLAGRAPDDDICVHVLSHYVPSDEASFVELAALVLSEVREMQRLANMLPGEAL